MKLICLVAILGLTAVACHREDEAASGSTSKRKLPVKSGEKSEVQPGGKSGKVSQRDPSKKPIPMAEPVPGKPGFVKSPHSGNVVDVTNVPAGTVVADPGFPAEEEKYFRVPVMSDLAEEGKENEVAPFPSAASVANKPGFIINPYTNTEFDASDLEPGSAVMDPSGLPDETRFFQVPVDHVRREEKEADH